MELFLTPLLAAQFIYVLGLTIAILYLAILPKKSRDTWLVFIMLLAWLVMAVTINTYEITHTHQLQSGTGFNRVPYLTWLVNFCDSAVQFGLIVLIYRIGFIFAPREEKVVLVISAVFYIAMYISYWFFYESIGTLVAHTIIIIYGNLTLDVWLILVGARKLWRAKMDEHDFRRRQLVLIVLLAAVATFIHGYATSTISFWPFSAASRGLVPMPMEVLVVSLLIIGYLLYGEEKHTLLVKLVGFLLIAYVATFSVVLPTMRTEIGLRRDFMDPNGMPSRSFTPDSLGGYTMESIEPRWIEPGSDSYFIADDEAVLARSDFSFPFYGAVYDSIWVGTNGSLSFGIELDADHTFSEGASFSDNTPSVVPMYADFLMSGAGADVRIESSREQFVVTWNRASVFDILESTVTMQATLFPDGHIVFNYRDVNTVPLVRFVGISPGGTFEPVDFDHSPQVSQPGQALVDHRDDSVSYRRFVHPLIVPVTRIGVIGLLLVLSLGIMFFRAGILRPLNRVLVGLGSVEQGDLGAEVVIDERNELGSLAIFFNRMTASLREYSTRMEELVEKRTEELDKTIVDLRSTQAQLIQSEKLASLGSLTAGIAHEIKNPLNFVNNFAEVSEEMAAEAKMALAAGDTIEAGQLLDEIIENTSQIAKHGRRADSIVRSMMQHARGGASDMEAIELNTYLEEYINLAWHGMRARDENFQAEVMRDFGMEVGTVTVMPQELGRVVLNLLNNAFDAVRQTENARVTVSTVRTDPDAVTITFSDNGPGIPPEIREKIFEPFFTTKATGEGTGLGLSLSYDIITKGHGGTMTVGDSPDGGALFIIRLGNA